MSDYNLTDNVNDSFQFELRGVKYTMRYPTLDELEKLQVIVKESPDDNEKIMDFVYSYITPEAGGKDIKAVLPKENIRVMKNFTEMVKAEFDVG